MRVSPNLIFLISLFSTPSKTQKSNFLPFTNNYLNSYKIFNYLKKKLGNH